MIRNINIGVKIATKDFKFIPEIYSNKKIIDFIEIILMSNFTSKDIEIIRNLDMPYALHIPNVFQGIDFGNILNNNKNLEYIKKLNKNLKNLNPICLIVHPETGDLKLSIENIQKIKLKPVALENMPYKSLVETETLAFDIPGLKAYFSQISDLEFCLDIGHAIKTSISKKIDYETFLLDLINFKDPIIFHISGGTMDNELDEHLPLYENHFNLTKIKNLLFNIQKPVYLTFETPRDYEKGIKDDLININIFIES